MSTSHTLRGLLGSVLILSCAGAYGCGGDDAPPFMTSTAGKGGGGKKDAGDPFVEPKDAGTKPENDGGPTKPQIDKNAPIVMILDPAGAVDPNDDAVLIDELVTVRCRVAKSTAPTATAVNLAAVRILQVNPDDPTHPIAGTVVAQGDGVFQAEFKLSDVPNGPLSFRCEADDMSAPVVTGRDTVDTLLDLGPVVELERPTDGSSHRLLGNVQIAFRVKDAPLARDDDESTPTALELVVSGVPFEFTESPDEPGLYTAAVNFDDRMRYPMPPTTAEIVVAAKSSRTPEAPTRRVKSTIKIDSEGPKIVITSPADGQIVRSDVPLTVTITDDSGVDRETVIGTIALAGDDYILSDWNVNGTTYTETFDTRSFDPTLTQLTINIVAKDMVGNLSTPATLLIRIDNVAPVLSLDPPKVREYTKPGDKKVCSEPFDPVGSDAVSDLDVVSLTEMYRVMVHERTNYSPGQNYGYIAGVDTTSMQLYARRDLSIPLLIDTDGDPDHVCDDVNYDGLPIVEQRPIVLGLSPVVPRGSSRYSTTPNFADPENIADGDCTVSANESMPPRLCPSSPMTRIISQQIEGAAPAAIYGRMPTNAATGECSGQEWLLPFAEGWVCIAAKVKDNIGNVGISKPLRVCLDDGAGTPVCNPATDTPPTCTDGCKYPIDFAANQTLLVR